MIKDLIRDLSIGKISLTDALNTAKVLAHKLKKPEFKIWVNQQLEGYDDNEIETLPKFRNLKCKTFLIHKLPDRSQHHKEVVGSKEHDEFLYNYGYTGSIPLLEQQLEGKVDGYFTADLEPEHVRNIAEADPFGKWVIGGKRRFAIGQVRNIIEQTKQYLMELLLNLDEQFPEFSNEFMKNEDLKRDASEVLTTNIEGAVSGFSEFSDKVKKRDTMKIFISHASANKKYGNALVDLLIGIGIPDDRIIFTSNNAHGVPNGANIFDWLKSQIVEGNYVIYLLSKEYYESVACLNEMGAAWVTGNKHSLIFLPKFDLGSRAFLSGAINPRTLGFFIHDKERLLKFYQDLLEHFSLSSNIIRVTSSIDRFLAEIALFSEELTVVNAIETTQEVNPDPIDIAEPIIKPMNEHGEGMKLFGNFPKQATSFGAIYNKLLSDIESKNILDEELMMFHYIIDRAKIKLGTGWQTQNEIEYIRSWEDVNGLNNKLSAHYEEVLRRFELKGYTQESAWTSNNNPKEVKLISEISDHLFNFPKVVKETIKNVLAKNPKLKHPSVDDLPF